MLNPIVVKHIRLDRYVLDVLMRDLVGHDRQPAAFLVYLHLWVVSAGTRARRVRTSHQRIADEVGLSKSGVQQAIRHLKRRRLVRAEKAHPTAMPEYTVLRPWVRPRAAAS